MKKNYIIVCFFLTFLFGISFASATKIYVYPSNIKKNLGDTFTVDVKLDSVSDLYGYEFKLYWDTKLLDCVNKVSYVNGIWSKNYQWKNELNEGLGYVWISYSGLSPATSFNGNIKLATLTFKTTGSGKGNFNLYETKLATSNGNKITHDVGNGYFEVSGSYIRSRGVKTPTMADLSNFFRQFIEKIFGPNF